MKLQEIAVTQEAEEKVLPKPILLTSAELPKGVRGVEFNGEQGIEVRLFIPTPETETGEERRNKDTDALVTTKYARADSQNAILLPYADEAGDRLRLTTVMFSKPKKQAATTETGGENETDETDEA